MEIFHPSARPWRLASRIAPASTPISVPPSSTCPAPMIAVDREGQRHAGQRPRPRDRVAAARAAASGFPNDWATPSPRRQPTCRPQMRSPRCPALYSPRNTSDGHQRRAAKPEHDERRERAERKEGRPHQPVA